MDKNAPASAADTGLIPGSRKIPHAMEQLSLCAITTEPALWNPEATTTEARTPRTRRSHQNEKPPLSAIRENPHKATMTQCSGN